jgi:hypothetical protein
VNWSIQAGTALISAVTSAAVTLLIELAAKPRLEARKDRILESYRHIRELRFHLSRFRMAYPNARLLRNTHDLVWKLGKSTLDVACKPLESFSSEEAFSPLMLRIQFGLTRIQHRLAAELIAFIDDQLVALYAVVTTHALSGRLVEIGDGEHCLSFEVDKAIYNLDAGIVAALAVLNVSRRNPLRYIRALHKYRSYPQKIENMRSNAP